MKKKKDTKKMCEIEQTITYICTNCGDELDTDSYNYCPSCGAKVEKGW